MAMTREPRLDKSLIPNGAIKDQGSIGLYFEYTYAMCQLSASGLQILFRNTSLFAVGNNLLLRRSVGEVNAANSTPAKLKTTDGQVNYRTDDKSGLGRDLTDDEAFLTVMRAWEYATSRPAVSHIVIPGPSATSTPEHISVGAHALVNEPLAWPISDADTEKIRKGDRNTARRLARQAEAGWLATGTERAHTDETPAHRLPMKMAEHELDRTVLLGKMVMGLIAKPAADFPEYQPPTATPSDILPDALKLTATGENGWS